MTAPSPVAGERGQAIAVPGAARRIAAYRAVLTLALGLAGTGAVLVYYWHRHPPQARGASHERSPHGAATEMRLPKLSPPAEAAVADPAVALGTGPGRDPAATVPAPPGWPLAGPGLVGPAPMAAAAGPVATAAGGNSRPSRRAVSPVLLRETAPAPTAVAPTDAVAAGEKPPPSPVRVVRAAALPAGRFLLPRGSFLDCTLETAVDSTLPGLATCVVATDQYGADGTVVLLARGSRLVGETHADVRDGQARVAITWSEARTADGVVLPLGAPATDALGRTGVPGAVDRHTVDRFGAAVLLSVIDGATQALANRRTAGTGVVYNVQGGHDVATEALRQSIHIPPTIRVEPGARVSVTVATDVDFSAVYALVRHDAP